MWYFSWILGLGLATTFGVLNAIWYDVVENQLEKDRMHASRDGGKKTAATISTEATVQK